MKVFKTLQNKKVTEKSEGRRKVNLLVCFYIDRKDHQLRGEVMDPLSMRLFIADFILTNKSLMLSISV